MLFLRASFVNAASLLPLFGNLNREFLLVTVWSIHLLGGVCFSRRDLLICYVYVFRGEIGWRVVMPRVVMGICESVISFTTFYSHGFGSISTLS